MRFYSSRLAVGAIAIGLGLGTGQAFAADADATAKALVAAMTADNEAEVSYADASANGDDVTINELKITGNGNTATIPAIVLTGVGERDKGGFTAKSISLDGGSMVSDKANIKWETASVDDAVVPSPDEIKAKKRISPFSKMTIGKIDITGGDMPAAVDIDQVDVSLAVGEDGTPNKFTTAVDGIKLPQALFGADATGVLSALGYTDAFNVDVNLDGGYEHTTDTLTLTTFTIDTANVGKLAIDAKISGIPLSKLGEGTSPLDLESKGKLESFHLRFDNAGVVEKVLDMQAQQAGMKRADVVSQFTGALPLLLNVINNEAFQGKIATAVTAFLNDPKSITLSAAPSAPVGFDAIANAISASPQSVPDLVGADISANN